MLRSDIKKLPFNEYFVDIFECEYASSRTIFFVYGFKLQLSSQLITEVTCEFLDFQIIHSDDILDLSSQLITEVAGEFLDFQIIHSDDILDFVW